MIENRPGKLVDATQGIIIVPGDSANKSGFPLLGTPAHGVCLKWDEYFKYYRMMRVRNYAMPGTIDIKDFGIRPSIDMPRYFVTAWLRLGLTRTAAWTNAVMAKIANLDLPIVDTAIPIMTRDMMKEEDAVLSLYNQYLEGVERVFCVYSS